MSSRLPLRARRAGLLLPALLIAAAPSALAASFSVPDNTTDTVPKTLSGADTGVVGTNATLSSNTSTPTVTWTGSTGAGPTLTNSGTIQNIFDTGSNSGRAIDMNFTGATSNFTLTNNPGAIITSGNDVFRINKSIGAGSVTVNNYGTMQSTGLNGDTNGQAIDFNANTTTTGTVTINNFATGVMSAEDADAIRPGNRVTINNYGSIEGKTTGDTGNDGIDFQDPGKSGTVNNYGSTASITGARHGITAKEAIAVYNEGVIQGRAGSGLNIDTITNSPVMLVTNTSTGQIIGNAIAGADADGIDIDRLATINNSGAIKALGLSSGPNLNEAIAIGGGTINNFSGGTIFSDQRAITVDNSSLGNAFAAVTIYNEGAITGSNGEAVKVTSTFDNTLINKGTISGSVVLGAGADAVSLYAGSSVSGTIDGGGGADVIHLLGTGSGTLGATSNVETLSVESGSWTLNGAGNYAAGGSVAAGAALEIDNTSVSFGGTFIVNGTLKTDPASLEFLDLDIDPNASIQASDGDIFDVHGNFNNHSTKNTEWDTLGATLEFTGAGAKSHELLLTGDDLGADLIGFDKNFAWKELFLDSDDILDLGSGTGGLDLAFYTRIILGALFSGNQITNIFGNGFNIYYDPRLAENAYLEGRRFNLAGDGGGVLAPVKTPEPASLPVLLSGLGLLVWAGGRARRSRL